MIVNLHGLLIALRTQDERVRRQWRTLFDYELAEQFLDTVSREPQIVLEVKVQNSPPLPPDEKPVYVSNFPPLQVYGRPEDIIILVPSTQVHIHLKLGSPEIGNNRQEADIVVSITPCVLEDDSFEDVITLALAPLLRRRGFFMVHAFSASFEQKAAILVGPSGSGKTTSGLALVYQGWDLLANDIALLRDDEPIAALLSPGTVHVTPVTLALLPELAESHQQYAAHPHHGKSAIPRLALLQLDSPNLSSELKAVYFPEVGHGPRHEIDDMSRAVGLARMLEASMDQWDRQTWHDHMDFLEKVSHQVRFRTLILGQVLHNLPQLLEQDLHRL